MKKFFPAIVGFIIASILCYGFWSFILADLNVFSWEKDCRIAMIVSILFVWQMLPITMKVYLPNKDEKNNY